MFKRIIYKSKYTSIKQAYAGVDCFMLFTQAEIEVLALCGWCKDLSADRTGTIPAEIIHQLIDAKLLRLSKSALSFRVTGLGYSLLQSAGFELKPEKYYRGKGLALDRRLQTARIAAFFWRYGAEMYCNSTSEQKYNRFVPSFEFRRKSASNILGGTRMTGFYYTDNFTFIPYYIALDNEGIYADVELRTFRTESLSCSRTPFVIYTGAALLQEIILFLTTKRCRKPKNTTDEYFAAMSKFGKYCAVMPLDENGYRQLRILDEPKYREKIGKLIAGRNFSESKVSLSDGQFENSGEEIVIGFDCNISRFESIVLNASKQTHIFILDFQTEALQEFFKGHRVILHPLKTEEVEKALNIPAKIPEISAKPFITKKGEYLDVSVIRQAQKT